jgi:hypothetical protein
MQRYFGQKKGFLPCFEEIHYEDTEKNISSTTGG